VLADQAHDKLIKRLLLAMGRFHARNAPHKCDCEYCVKLKEYARSRIAIHRVKKRIRDDYFVDSDLNYLEDLRFYAARKQMAKNLVLLEHEKLCT
jgi:hypothetical protein